MLIYRRIIRTLSIFALSAGLFGAAAVQASPLLSDLVEPDDGWVVTGNTLFFLGGCCGVAPTAGANFIHIQNSGGREASKSFVGYTLQAGHYTLTFDIGNFNNAPFAVIDQAGMTAGGALLAAASSFEPTPPDATVGTWTLTYDILAGDLAIGQVLGFMLRAPDTGNSANASFDNLKIDFEAAASGVPEPATLMLLAVSGLAIGLSRRRKTAAR